MKNAKKKIAKKLLVVFIIIFMLAGCGNDDESDFDIKSKINLIYPRDGSGGIQRLMTEFEELRGDVIVNGIEVPGNRSGYFQGYTVALAANQRLPDVMILHDTWLAEFANRGFLMELNEERNIEVENYYYPGMIQAVEWHGRKFAVPLWQDMPLLSFRTDLISSTPDTWSQINTIAEDIMQDFELSYGLVFPANDASARAAFMASLLISHNALPDFSTNNISYNESNIRSAFDRLTSMIENEIISRDVLNMSAEDSRQVFESGNAAYMMNWSYADRLLSKEDSHLAGRADSIRIPMASNNYDSQGLMSGWALAVSSQTAENSMAQAIVSYLVANNNQQRMAIENGKLPAKVALYDDLSWQNTINISQALTEMMDTGIPLMTGSNPENKLNLLSEVLIQAFDGASSKQLVSYLIDNLN